MSKEAMSNEEFNKIYEAHVNWLTRRGHVPAGTPCERADLSGRDLSSIDLCDVVLSGADLSDTNLAHTRMSNTVLRNVDLTGADLSYANLFGADLSYADLIGADLTGADLSEANLANADLTGANLTGARLDRANLVDAEFTRANLLNTHFEYASAVGATFSRASISDTSFRRSNLARASFRTALISSADFSEANVAFTKFPSTLPQTCAAGIPMTCPSLGTFTGWKKAFADSDFRCHIPVIVELRIPASAKRSSATTRKCRCDKAKVVSIKSIDDKQKFTEAKSGYRPDFVYRVGETVAVDDFDTDRFNQCSTGIHFFVTREEAVNY